MPRDWYPRHWILDHNHDPVAVEFEAWGRWFNDIDNRRVAFTELRPGVHVSTVFLGLESFGRGERPLLFESMAFTDYGGDDTDRYATWAEAQLGHNRMVEAIRARMREKKVTGDGPDD